MSTLQCTNQNVKRMSRRIGKAARHKHGAKHGVYGRRIIFSDSEAGLALHATKGYRHFKPDTKKN